MNIKFEVNDYLIIWSLLFGASVTESIHKLKQKLWINYKNEYNSAYNDKNLILKEGKNFIPNDDTIYNILLETKEYEKIKKSVEKYRLELTKLWDNKTNKISQELANILKMPVDEFIIYTVDDDLNFIDTAKTPGKNKAIIIGKKIDKKDPNKLLIELSYEMLKKEIKDYRIAGSNKFIADAIIDLAIKNELATRINKKSYYFTGNFNLTQIKRQLYPYWLMYLGISKEEMTSYMLRDKIAFDVERFPYDKALKNMDLESFIDFCIKNKNHMIKEEQLEVI